MKSKTILLSALVLAIAIVSSALIITNRNNSINQPTSSEVEITKTTEDEKMVETKEEEKNVGNGLKLFTSEQAGLTIELPDYFVMTEEVETQQYPGEAGLEEYLSAQVIFTNGKYTEGYDNRIVVSYAKPVIYGKGGSCVDDNGDPSYATEVIAGKSMEVCKRDLTMSAAYILNPNQKIEYVISVYADNQDLFDVLMDSVGNKLKFI